MEMKRWGLFFSGLCLLLAFSVSSVAVAGQCDLCAKCDQDGDGLIRDVTPCLKKCPGTTDDNDNQDLGMCPVDDGAPTKYTVTLTGAMSDDSTHDSWSASRPNAKGIGLEAHVPHSNMPMTLNLNFFASMADGDKCFGTPNTLQATMTPLFAGWIRSRSLKGGITQAQASFWFEGTNVTSQSLFYILTLFGTFSDASSWPSTNTLTMTDWAMGAASGDGQDSQTACVSEGFFAVNNQVSIKVKAHADADAHPGP